jgi:glutamine synthetase
VKELAHPLGIMPSFMAKPSASLPGCSGHLHQNLAHLNDHKNAFLDEYLFFPNKNKNKKIKKLTSKISDPNKMSALFKSYLAGQLQLLPEFLPFFAPNVNSYKRLGIFL